jgi:hypothetical protein
MALWEGAAKRANVFEMPCSPQALSSSTTTVVGPASAFERRLSRSNEGNVMDQTADLINLAEVVAGAGTTFDLREAQIRLLSESCDWRRATARNGWKPPATAATTSVRRATAPSPRS